MGGLDLLLCSAFALMLPAGQLMFKWAAMHPARAGARLPAALLQRWRLGAALGWYGLTALFWFYILTRVPLSVAFPFSIAGSALVPLAAGLVFRERLSWRYAAGYVLMLTGLFVAVSAAR
jgi:drug/metabolite transporter (DMT)-like permease